MEFVALSGLPSVPVQSGEFWTSKQRDGHSLHEVSYRACYKPQLPAYFITRYCVRPNMVVYDPFMGRGTTLIEAQLRGQRAIGNDVNPLTRILALPRLNPPSSQDVEKRLQTVDLSFVGDVDTKLLVFFHPVTLREIYAWRAYFGRKKNLDNVDAWLQMVACGRLTGHSFGFFSVYTLPPNLATSVTAQRKINTRRQQTPSYRDTKTLILRKSRQLLRHPLPAHFFRRDALLLNASAEDTPQIASTSVDLIITSPPFLDTVNYQQDNWLRMWFCNVRVAEGKIWQIKSLDDWIARMTAVFHELHRVLKPAGRIAFEVGEIRNGTVFLENAVIAAATEARLFPEHVIINTHNFTKTANCWGVANNQKGTNSNRIVVLRRG